MQESLLGRSAVLSIKLQPNVSETAYKVPEDEDSMFLHNVGICVQAHTSLQPKRLTSTSSPLCEPQMSYQLLLFPCYISSLLTNLVSQCSEYRHRRSCLTILSQEKKFLLWQPVHTCSLFTVIPYMGGIHKRENVDRDISLDTVSIKKQFLRDVAKIQNLSHTYFTHTQP
jgi:hypothetical protein